jgi:aromatic-L-amino-acid decarboxylase
LTGKPLTSALDPENWQQFGDICHQMVDEMLEQLRTVGERPVWQPMPDQLRRDLQEPVPDQPQGARKVCDDFRNLVLPYTAGNTHPRFFGWVHGTGTAGGMLAEWLSGAVNANLGGRDHAPVAIERVVVEWMRQIFKFPASSSGILVSGTSMATLIGLTVARNQAVRQFEPDCDVREEGLMHVRRPLVAYASSEAHSSIGRALELLGLGRRYLRTIPVNAEFQLNVEALRDAIRVDREAGLHPFCVIGTAGTVNTGAVDPLIEIAGLCADENLWLHVDGAFGALARLSDDMKHQVIGIELADSLAFDFHKWLHVPYDAGCLLVRDGKAHRAAFQARPNYLAEHQRGVGGGDPWFCDYGPELSRGFRALKVWFTIKEHGLQRLGQKITENCQQASWLAGRIDAHPMLERLAPTNLNVVCFRVRSDDLTEGELDELNREIVLRLQEDGVAVPSTTRLAHRLAIRVCITNHRTQLADLDEVLREIVRNGRSIVASCRTQRERQAMVSAACRRPELRLLAESVEFVFDNDTTLPFAVSEFDHITLGSSCFVDSTVLGCMLRHALEIRLLHRVVPQAATMINRAAIALLACRATGRFVQLLEPTERALVLAGIPEWLGHAFQLTKCEALFDQDEEQLAAVVERLLAFQGEWSTDAEADLQLDWGAISAVVERSRGLSAPAEHLMTVGGDSRIAIDAATSRNQYGCAPRPEDQVIRFSSSTASSISKESYDAVERLRQQFLMAAFRGDLQQQYRQQLKFVTDKLNKWLVGSDEQIATSVCLCASGTDTELIALGLIQSAVGKPITNLIVAPDETGSKVLLAAGGKHHSCVTPLGTAAHEGETLPEFSADSIQVETIQRRSEQGRLRPIDDVESEIAQIVKRHVEANRHCIVHLVDSSKTGWRAPRAAFLRSLRDGYRGQISIVVDACQMRCATSTVRSYLQCGFLVQISGSKFFGGPAFAGALLVPPALASELSRLTQRSEGVAQYMLGAVLDGGSRLAQISALARWTAAIQEMERFFSLPSVDRMALMNQITAAVSRQLADCEVVLAVAESTGERGLETAEPWDQQRSIVPFLICEDPHADVQRPLPFASVRQVYLWLAEDLSGSLGSHLSADDLTVAARRCQLGQPVKTSHASGITTGMLRLCIGARELAAAAEEASDDRGDGPTQWVDDVAVIARKMELIMQYRSLLSATSDRGRATAVPINISTHLSDLDPFAFHSYSGETQ